MNNDLMFSSKTDMWATPQAFFDKLNEAYSFTLDVCATKENAKCRRFFTKEDDGLSQDWNGVCWMNPPYGRDIKHWLKKAYEESKKGATVVCLIPSRTDTIYWHEYVMKGNITFIKGRLVFGDDAYWQSVWGREYINCKKNSLYKKYGRKNAAPFPSAVVVFGGGEKRIKGV